MKRKLMNADELQQALEAIVTKEIADRAAESTARNGAALRGELASSLARTSGWLSPAEDAPHVAVGDPQPSRDRHGAAAHRNYRRSNRLTARRTGVDLADGRCQGVGLVFTSRGFRPVTPDLGVGGWISLYQLEILAPLLGGDVLRFLDGFDSAHIRGFAR